MHLLNFLYNTSQGMGPFIYLFALSIMLDILTHFALFHEKLNLNYLKTGLIFAFSLILNIAISEYFNVFLLKPYFLLIMSICTSMPQILKFAPADKKLSKDAFITKIIIIISRCLSLIYFYFCPASFLNLAINFKDVMVFLCLTTLLIHCLYLKTIFTYSDLVCTRFFEDEFIEDLRIEFYVKVKKLNCEICSANKSQDFDHSFIYSVWKILNGTQKLFQKSLSWLKFIFHLISHIAKYILQKYACFQIYRPKLKMVQYRLTSCTHLFHSECIKFIEQAQLTCKQCKYDIFLV